MFEDSTLISKARLKETSFVLVLIIVILFSSQSYSDEFEDAYWQSVDCQVEREVQAYLNQYPQGSYVEQANMCLATIAAKQQAQKQEQTPQPGIVEEVTLEIEKIDETAQLVQQIKKRLVECKAHFKANRLTSGKEGNALECYQSILQLEPDHPKGLSGIKQIEDRYIGWIERAIQSNDFSKAKNLLARLKKSEPKEF